LYEFHELANAFPLIEGTEFDDLVASIRDNGQREAITYYEGKILDGRNRYRACLEAGVTPFGGNFEGEFDDARKFVIDLNVHRRHLDESQRAMAAAKLATLSRGANQHAQIRAPSQSEMADALNVSRTSVQSAKRVLNDGVPELVQAVERGEKSVSAAAEIAKLPEAEQRERVQQPGGYASLTGNNEWYTPAEYIERARRVMGVFDLDPASNTIAQERVQASKFFTKEDDGLVREWHGRVWLNPPYSQPEIGHFIEKLVTEYELGRLTEVRFVTPDGEQAGSPAMGQAFLYFGARAEAFAREFGEIGFIPDVLAADLSLAEAA
jgi:hypothetical protein